MKHDDFIFYQFSRVAVEAADFKDFLARFGVDVLPHGKRLARMMNRIVPFVEGYDRDPRELYAIPEVRAFYRGLVRVWPNWLFFGNLQTESLMTLVLCTVPSLESMAFKGSSQVQVAVDPKDLLEFVVRHLPAMNGLCERAGFSERQVYQRTKEVFAYFNLPF